MKLLFTTLLVLIQFFLFNKTNAQDPHFTQFYVSPLYTNPANAGTGQLDGKQAARFGLQYRNHYESWVKQTAISYDQKITKLHGGIGVTGIFNNNSTIIKTNTFGINYSLHSKINDQMQLNSGIGIEQNYKSLSNLGFYNQSTNKYILYPTENIHYANLHIGMLLLAKQYSLGIALHNILTPNSSFNIIPNQIIPISITVHGGYIYQFERVNIIPQISFQKQDKYTETNFNLNLKIKTLTIGIGKKLNTDPYRTGIGTTIGNLGYHHKNFKFMFNYEGFYGRKISFPRNSMEFSLIYSIKTKKESTVKFLALY